MRAVLRWLWPDSDREALRLDLAAIGLFLFGLVLMAVFGSHPVFLAVLLTGFVLYGVFGRSPSDAPWRRRREHPLPQFYRDDNDDRRGR